MMVENQPTPVFEHAHRAVALLAGMVVVAFAGLFLGESGRAFAGVGFMVIPLALLAMASYAGERIGWARAAAVVLLFGIALLTASGFAGQAEQLLEARDAADTAPEHAIELIWLIAGLGFLAAALALLAPVRKLAARALPIDQTRLVHAVALALTASLCASAFAPLVVLGEPPLTALAAQAEEPSGPGSSALYEHAYELLWLLPTSVLLVGYGLRRNLRECLERLGLFAPTVRQVLGAIGLAMGLVVFAALFGGLVGMVFEALGWSVTDQSAVERLMGDIISPAGALVVGVSAGLGEELLVRGALQPRLGILVSNLLFTALHAAQYNVDLLLVIFALGLCFGLIRKYSNTTQSVLVHAFYDMLLILAATAAL